MLPREAHKLQRLLIADENRSHLNELRHALECAGYSVATSHNGAQALDAARSLRPHLVILEAILPDESGIDVARTIQEEKIAPAVMLTTLTHRSFVRRAADAGIYSYLTKPFHGPSLVAAIEIAHSQWMDFRAQEQRVQHLQRVEQRRVVVDAAKRLIMTTCGYTEPAAYRLIQLRSMNLRRSMRAIAEEILASQQALQLDDADLPTQVSITEEAA
jgi:AmiR/NasT family two-component response regulator